MSLLQREAEILKVGFPLDSVDAVRVLVVLLVKDGVRQGVAAEEKVAGQRAASHLVARTALGAVAARPRGHEDAIPDPVPLLDLDAVGVHRINQYPVQLETASTVLFSDPPFAHFCMSICRGEKKKAQSCV